MALTTRFPTARDTSLGIDGSGHRLVDRAGQPDPMVQVLGERCGGGSGVGAGIPAKVADGFGDVIQHRATKAGIHPDEHGVVHDLVCAGQIARHAEGVGAVLAQIREGRLPHQVAAKKHPVADLGLVEAADSFLTAERCGGFDAQHETEPGAVGAMTGAVPGTGSFSGS